MQVIQNLIIRLCQDRHKNSVAKFYSYAVKFFYYMQSVYTAMLMGAIFYNSKSREITHI